MPMTAPTLSVAHTTVDDIRLAWTAASGGTGPYTYELHRCLQPAFDSPDLAILLTESDLLTFDDGAAPDGAFVYYRVVATDSAAENATSNVVTAVKKARGMTAGPRRRKARNR